MPAVVIVSRIERLLADFTKVIGPIPGTLITFVDTSNGNLMNVDITASHVDTASRGVGYKIYKARFTNMLFAGVGV